MGRRLGCGILVCGLAALLAQSDLPGGRAVSYQSPVDGSSQPYAIYVPKSLDRARKYPLVIVLHEEDSNHVVALKHVFGLPNRYGETGLQALTTFPTLPDVDYIVASPFGRGTMGYQGIAEQDVWDVMADVEHRYPIDEDRVYLTGSSMGGGAALRMALIRPDVWAAVAPVCPAIIPGSEGLEGNALDLPVRLFHGEMDPAVPAESTRQLHRRLLEAGVAADYIEFPAVRHNAWDAAYRNGSIFDWFGKFKRDREPTHVRFATRSQDSRSAYWVRIDGFVPGSLASIDAVKSGADVRVQTREVDAFTLTTPIRTINIDGAVVRIRPGASLSFVRSGGRWAQAVAPATSLPRGPIVEAVNQRHIYVYGAGHEQARKYAETAAAWSTARARLNVSFLVKSDEEVTDVDLDSANFVLFGNQQTNRLIARLAPRLPMALNPGAADYGLLFIATVGTHYALVSSGLPWWIGADEVNRGGYRFSPDQYRLLSTFGDYVLFKGSLTNVLAEGRFDRGGRVPDEDSPKLESTGVVTLR